MLVHTGYDFGYWESVQFGDGICSTSVSVVGLSSGISLSWNQVSGAEKYSIYRREDWQDWKEDWILIGNTTANVTSFADNSQLSMCGLLLIIKFMYTREMKFLFLPTL